MAQMYQSGRYCKAPIKVYGKASVGAPPMSVPHRFKNDQWRKAAVIWPFAGFQPDS
jgi:L-2-hydroxyglutarate oxidase LhgO